MGGLSFHRTVRAVEAIIGGSSSRRSDGSHSIARRRIAERRQLRARESARDKESNGLPNRTSNFARQTFRTITRSGVDDLRATGARNRRIPNRAMFRIWSTFRRKGDED